MYITRNDKTFSFGKRKREALTITLIHTLNPPSSFSASVIYNKVAFRIHFYHSFITVQKYYK